METEQGTPTTWERKKGAHWGLAERGASKQCRKRPCVSKCARFLAWMKAFASVTSDHGTEFGALSDLEQWGTRVCFAPPYSSGERGQNERHNGLFRRFLLKVTALESYTVDELFLIADELNHLPRRRLAYRTLDEFFETELDNIYQIQHGKRLPTGCSICNCN